MVAKLGIVGYVIEVPNVFLKEKMRKVFAHDLPRPSIWMIPPLNYQGKHTIIRLSIRKFNIIYIRIRLP